MLRSACLFLLLTLLALPASAQPAPRCGFLFTVDTSSAMSRLNEPAQQTLFNLIATGLNGAMRPGEEFTVWTFNDEINARDVPVLAWTPQLNQALAARAAQHVKLQKFRHACRMDRLVPQLLAAMKSTELLVVIIISDGNEVIVGTPFDRKINVTYGARAEEMRRTKKPFVTTLAARRGDIVDFAVTLGNEPVVLSNFRSTLAKAGERTADGELKPFTPPTSVPVLVKPGVPPVAATNVLQPPSVTAKAAPPLTKSTATNSPPTPAATVEVKKTVPPAAPVKPTPSPTTEKKEEKPATPAPAPTATKPAETKPPNPQTVPTANSTKQNLTNIISPASSSRITITNITPEMLASLLAPPATSVPVLVTNRPPVVPPVVTQAPKTDFLEAPVATISPSASNTAPKETKTEKPAPILTTPSVTASATETSQPSTNAPDISPPRARNSPAPQAAIVTPAANSSSHAGLLAAAVVLLLAGFWLIRPWLRKPAPSEPQSLISQSLDKRHDGE
ncbi:MAG: hypothetical protein HY300_00415 [Verrucomicrobia bacterium]|nr:hypothetical protein [Verrucomicrobiota bacterium]